MRVVRSLCGSGCGGNGTFSVGLSVIPAPVILEIEISLQRDTLKLFLRLKFETDRISDKRSTCLSPGQVGCQYGHRNLLQTFYEE